VKQHHVEKILNTFYSYDWSDEKEHFDFPKDYQGIGVPKKCTWYRIHGKPEFQFVRDLIHNDIKSINENYTTGEVLTILEYPIGGYFAPHTDKYISDKSDEITIASGGYNLNDEYEGGDFIIDGKKIDKSVGELFYFGRGITHEVTEITKGKRLSLHFTINEIVNPQSKFI
jgi:hypothetical protein